jgi:host factor-I protein
MRKKRKIFPIEMVCDIIPLFHSRRQIMKNLQDVFLNVVRRDRIPVTVFLVNGFQIKGLVRGFDNFIVVVDTDGKQQMIYKSAVSTISPVTAVNFVRETETGTSETTEE